MTRLEKLTIENALIEYVERHKNADDVKERTDGIMADTILTYWKDVVEAKCGTVTI
jgi:hypothetical protein